MTRYALELVKAKKLKISKKFRVCNFDIETLASVDAEHTPQPIIAIAAHDNFSGDFNYWEIKEQNLVLEALSQFLGYRVRTLQELERIFLMEKRKRILQIKPVLKNYYRNLNIEELLNEDLQ